MMRMIRPALVVGVCVVLVAACGGAGDGGDGDDGSAARSCDPAALDGATTPVTITLWHNMSSANEEVLTDQIEAFHRAQNEVRVEAVFQGSYQELFTKYKAGLSSGDLPDVVQMEETTVQQLLDSESTVPVQRCIDAEDYPLDDFVPAALDYYTVDDTLVSMPWAVSNPVLFYDRAAFTAAGLDPDDPPTTLADVEVAAQAIVASGARPHGMALQVLPYVVEFLYAKSGLPYVDNGGGRDARATKALLDQGRGPEIWEWWARMVDSGLAIDTGSQQGGTDHLLALGNKQAAMTLEASAALGPIYDVLSSGQFPDIEIGVAPLPALTAGGGVPVGDGSLWLPEASNAMQRAAAWKLVKFLVDAKQQASLHVASKGGYVPVRQSVANDAAAQQLWNERPGVRVPFDQLLAGSGEPAASGSVIGDYQGVRDAVTDALVAMLAGDLTPHQAVAQATTRSTAAIAVYNERIA
jgi:sn-glycerol 3-phosphate transport system substrate-binding protein